MANPDPSRRTRFKPGQSGNPSGKSKDPDRDPDRDRTVAVALDELLHSRRIGSVEVPGGRLVLDLVCEKLLKESLKGNIRAMELLFDRAYGKVPTPVGEDPAAAAARGRADDLKVVLPMPTAEDTRTDGDPDPHDRPQDIDPTPA
jgi:hypothetical protein